MSVDEEDHERVKVRIARIEEALREIVRLTHGPAFSSLTLEIARVARQALNDTTPGKERDDV